MTWGPADERKHPRNPADGRWVEKVSAQMMMGGVSSGHFPYEGIGVPAAGLITTSQGSGTFHHMEFWDPDTQMWVQGRNAAVILEPPALQEKRIWFRQPVGAPQVKMQPGMNDRVTIRPAAEAEDVHYVTLGEDLPDPAMEYLDNYSGRWIPGADIKVTDGQGSFGADARWEYEPTGMEIQASRITGFSKHELLARPRHVPTRLDYMVGDPDNPGAHLMPAVDLLSSPSYVNGGYEILGPDGRWHLIEEVYQDDPDEEEMELIADGLHLPHLDTSEEISVRRAPY